MNEAEVKKLLSKHGITGNKSYDEVIELLEIKWNDLLERKNVKRGTDAEELEKQIEEIQAAMDYLNKVSKEEGTAITILEEASKEQETSLDFGTTKTRTISGMAANASGSTAASGSSNWFESVNNDANVNKMFLQATDCINYEQWDTAEKIFVNIASIEVRNPGACLGKVLAKYHLKTIKDIAYELTEPVDTDMDLKKAHDFGNPTQAKQVNEVLEERKKYTVYVEAEKLVKEGLPKTLYDAMELFRSISDYKDASSRIEECNQEMKSAYKTLYSNIMVEIKELYDVTGSFISCVKDKDYYKEICWRRSTGSYPYTYDIMVYLWEKAMGNGKLGDLQIMIDELNRYHSQVLEDTVKYDDYITYVNLIKRVLDVIRLLICPSDESLWNILPVTRSMANKYVLCDYYSYQYNSQLENRVREKLIKAYSAYYSTFPLMPVAINEIDKDINKIKRCHVFAIGYLKYLIKETEFLWITYHSTASTGKFRGISGTRMIEKLDYYSEKIKSNQMVAGEYKNCMRLIKNVYKTLEDIHGTYDRKNKPKTDIIRTKDKLLDKYILRSACYMRVNHYYSETGEFGWVENSYSNYARMKKEHPQYVDLVYYSFRYEEVALILHDIKDVIYNDCKPLSWPEGEDEIVLCEDDWNFGVAESGQDSSQITKAIDGNKGNIENTASENNKKKKGGFPKLLFLGIIAAIVYFLFFK